MRDTLSEDRRLRHDARILLLMMLFGPLLHSCAGGKAAVPRTSPVLSETALHALAASGPIGTITAAARIEINDNGDRRPLKLAMMLRRPADLRLESIPLLGPPDFFLSIEGGELRVFLPGRRAFFTGPAAIWNISRFFPLTIPADEIVSLLMGCLPEEETSSSWYEAREDGLYRVDQYRNGSKIRSLWIDPAGGVLIRVRTFTGNEEIVYTADFAEFTRVGNRFMPQRLTISSGDVSLALRYTEIRMLDGDAVSFALQIPEGITPIPLRED